MEPIADTPTDSELYAVPMPLRGMSVASFALGFFALVVFWWFPLAVWFSSMGLIVGLLAWLINWVRTRSLQERPDATFRLFALGGAAWCALVLSIVLTTLPLMHVLMRDL